MDLRRLEDEVAPASTDADAPSADPMTREDL
jgi:hypothetical protein